jgi:TfoX/Sxy family transcriptional regulator of competence genes
MPWVKVPAEHHPLFHAALPADPRVETMKMFGGVAAKVNGNVFAGLFGLSTMVLLSDADRADALALDGAAPFDPMGDGRLRSDKVMLPARMMRQPAELKRWIKRAFDAAAALPAKTTGAAKRAAPEKAAAARPAKKSGVSRAKSRS